MQVANILNITNGSCAVEIMKQADIAGRFLSWDDVLHDGPVPDNLSLEELSEVRAEFIIGRYRGAPEEIRKRFRARDLELRSCGNYEKIILWFEHDLYDQLQILQILDWFYSHQVVKAKLSIICTESYLGMLSPDEMRGLVKFEEAVTEQHLKLSSRAWSAFRANSPEKWYGLLNMDTSALPFLHGAVMRMLEEYPACSDGLSRTARQALKIISEGEKQPEKVFARYQESEERRFLGDSGFWVVLRQLLGSRPSLLTLSGGEELSLPIDPGQELLVTREGREVLAGKRSWLDIVELDRWLGGVHLTPQNSWCWRSSANSLSRIA